MSALSNPAHLALPFAQKEFTNESIPEPLGEKENVSSTLPMRGPPVLEAT